MRTTFIFLLCLVAVSMLGQTKGTITGTLTDKENKNTALPFANAVLKGTGIGVTTTDNGKYTLMAVAGTYTIQFSFIGYESFEEQVVITAGETKIINKALGSGGYKLQDVVIQKATSNREKESALFLDQKKAVEIKQSIGAQEMARKGVSTVEQGVAKISGVSKVDERGIYIRGLDDRYNYLQINGLNFIPSDPNLKTIPLNFIPTDIVRNIDVYKTFNSSLYQDFAGATINIITKDISSKPYSKLSISAGLNTLATFNDFKSATGGGNFLGYTGTNRNLPTVFNEKTAFGYEATPKESKDLFNASWNPDRTKAPLNFGTSITNSNLFSLIRNRKLGYIFNLNFSNNFLSQTGKRRNVNSEGTAFKDFDLTRWEYSTQKSVLASVNYKKTDKYNYLFNVIYIQNSENTIREFQGENSDFVTLDKPFFLRDTKYVENTSVGIQQLGTFIFKNKKQVLDYGIAFTIGKNNMPDRKILITEGVTENANFVTFNGVNPFRFFSVLNNINVNGKVEYQINFGDEVRNISKNTIRFGYNGDVTNFDFFNRTIRLNGGANLTSTSMNTDLPQQFFDLNFDNGNLFYASTADPTYKVEIAQTINAGFVNYTRNWENFTLDIGIRAEYMFRETRYRLETATVNSSLLKKKYAPFDFSPVLNLKYALNTKTNLRFTVSKTSTKARVREILPFRYQDGDGNFTIGNPDVKNTQNYNIDFKYEFFPKSGNMLSAAVFGKYIKNPIARIVEGTSTGFLEQYNNFDEATLFGIELEAAIGLDLLFGDGILAKKTSLSFNTIVMKSNEKADALRFPQLTSTSRALQGASNFILNADITYELAKSEKIESKISAIFNTFSDRIYGVGNSGAADFVEKPINKLDFTWRNTFNKKYQVNLTVKNALSSQILVTQDATKAISNPALYNNTSRQLAQGVNVGVEFSYTF